MKPAVAPVAGRPAVVPGQPRADLPRNVPAQAGWIGTGPQVFWNGFAVGILFCGLLVRAVLLTDDDLWRAALYFGWIVLGAAVLPATWRLGKRYAPRSRAGAVVNGLTAWYLVAAMSQLLWGLNEHRTLLDDVRSSLLYLAVTLPLIVIAQVADRRRQQMALPKRSLLWFGVLVSAALIVALALVIVLLPRIGADGAAGVALAVILLTGLVSARIFLRRASRVVPA